MHAIVVSGSIIVPSDYQDFIDLENINVRIQNFSSFEISSENLSKTGHYSLEANQRNGDTLRLNIYQFLHTPKGELLIKCKKEIVTNNQNINLDPILLEVIPQLSVGDKLPNFSAIDVDGDQVTLSDFKNKVVLFDFWSTYCGPCKALTPEINQIYEDLKCSNRFAVVGVSSDMEKSSAVDYFRQNNLEWINIHDGRQNPEGLYKKFGVAGIPRIYIN